MVVVPESQIQCYLLEGSTDYYYHSIAGAYQGFLFNNIQVDFVNFDQILETDLEVLYLPHPLMLPEKVVQNLKEFVRKGGILISEGCPAYYGDHGRAGEHQPNYGLDKLFGASEERVQFTPVLLEGMQFRAGGQKVTGGVYLQSYIPEGGSVTGTYDDGTVAVVDHDFGNGKARLIGTCPGYGFYQAEDDPGTRGFFRDLFKWSGKKQHVKCSAPGLVARVHQGNGFQVLWVVNSAREVVTAELEVSERWGPLDQVEEVVIRGSMITSGRKMNITVPARDVAIIRWSTS
jgi:beta-galactosidase